MLLILLIFDFFFFGWLDRERCLGRKLGWGGG